MSDPEINEDHLAALEPKFTAALLLKEKGLLDQAEEVLRGILSVEPRLAEPRLELGRIFLETDRLEQSEAQTREALRLLEAEGQWTEALPENVVLGLCCAQLAEILRRRADEDDVIFGNPKEFHAMVKESKSLFARASTLDPNDDYSSYYAFFMGTPEDQLPQ